MPAPENPETEDDDRVFVPAARERTRRTQAPYYQHHFIKEFNKGWAVFCNLPQAPRLNREEVVKFSTLIPSYHWVDFWTLREAKLWTARQRMMNLKAKIENR